MIYFIQRKCDYTWIHLNKNSLKESPNEPEIREISFYCVQKHSELVDNNCISRWLRSVPTSNCYRLFIHDCLLLIRKHIYFGTSPFSIIFPSHQNFPFSLLLFCLPQSLGSKPRCFVTLNPQSLWIALNPLGSKLIIDTLVSKHHFKQIK